MTTSVTFESRSETYPLSPFQHAALSYAARPLRLQVEAPLPAEELLDRAEVALRAMPELTATLVPALSSHIPRQASAEIHRMSWPGGGARLVAGSLSLCAEPTATATRLTIDVDALFADAVSIELLCAHIAAGSVAPTTLSFFDIAASHAAMLQDGELDEEETYWCAIQSADDARSALGCAASATERTAVATAPIDFNAVAGFAAAHDVGLADILHLALQLLLDRVCPNGAVLGWLIDTRDVMGLQGRTGALTQVAPDKADIDPEASPAALLERQIERRRRHAEMAGGPAIAQPPPTVIFDPRLTWRLPDRWRFMGDFEARHGALLMRGSRDGDRLILVANACDGVPTNALHTVLAAWRDVIEHIIQDPWTAWKLLPLGAMDDAETSRARPSARAERPAAEDICDQVRGFADLDPEACACRNGDQVVTRRALMGRVADLADALGPLEPDAVVAVVASAQLDLLAGWLAVLWRGGAFLPLLPNEPRQRIERAIVESGASVVLLGQDAPDFDALGQQRIIRFRDIPPRLGEPGAPTRTTPRQTAYLLRTSGSSGTPKLVMVSRGSLNNHLRWVAEDLLSDGYELPVVSSPIFDASFTQLLGPPYAGRAAWILNADTADPAQVFAELSSSDAPVSINCTPTYWAELLEIGANTSRRLLLRRLLLGGEAVGDTLRRRTADQYPDAEIWNLYGPTEATSTATAGRLRPDEPTHAGNAVAGAAITIADRHGRPLLHGLRGEIWISGPGVAKGYLHGVGQEAFSMLRHGEGSVLAYRSGDAGRFDEQGRLQLLGRLDDQLKLRGWRIEPEEIERVAETTPGVVSAKVILDTRIEPHELRLFFLGAADEATVLKTLRDWLPAAIAPAMVMRVAHLPRTATGKLDHRVLLELASSRGESCPDDYEPLQLEIATIWREVVGRGWPRVDENFFDAGGHSLALARLVNQLRARHFDTISLRQVVRNPTIRSIALIIQSASDGARAPAPKT